MTIVYSENVCLVFIKLRLAMHRFCADLCDSTREDILAGLFLFRVVHLRPTFTHVALGVS